MTTTTLEQVVGNPCILLMVYDIFLMIILVLERGAYKWDFTLRSNNAI